MRDARDELLRALDARAGTPCIVIAAHTRPWMSATFAGCRHEIELAIPAGVVSHFCAGIDAAELSLRGHFVADIVARPCDAGVRLEALTIAEGN